MAVIMAALESGTSTESVSIDTRTRDLIAIAICAFVLYALNVDFLLFGDAALYADYSLRHSFNEVVVHYGYYRIQILAQAIAGPLFNMPIQETMVWVNVLAGVVVVCLSYLLALELLGTRRRALMLVIILGLSGRVITNATSSEMYEVQTAFVLASFLLFMRQRIILAAIVATGAMLVSALSVFAFLFYPVYDYQRFGRVRWQTLVTLACVSLAFYVPFLIVHGYQLLWGVRGLLVITGVVKPDLPAALHNIPKYQFKQFTTMLLLFVPAFVTVREHKKFFLLALAVAIPHLYVIFKLTGEDNVFILNTDFFFAGILVLGWDWLWQQRPSWRLLSVLPVAAHLVILIWSQYLFSFTAHRDYAQEMKGFADRYLVNKDAAVITDWGTGVALTFYGRTAMDTALVNEPFFRKIYDIEDARASNATALKASTLYLIDRWKPTALNQFFSSRASLLQQTHVNSVREIAERRLHVSCTLIATETNRWYRCERTPDTPGL